MGEESLWMGGEETVNGGGSWDEEAGCIEERGESVGAEWE